MIRLSIQQEKQLSHNLSDFGKAEGAGASFVAIPDGQSLIERRRVPRDTVLIACDAFHIRVAKSQESRNEISALINRMYSWRDYQSALRATVDQENQTTLQACQGGQTLGTLSLNIDSDSGLLADYLYPREVDDLRRNGASLCELTGFAISERYGSSELLASLFHLLHILARYLHRVTDAVIEVNPRHALYYQRLLGFRQIGEQRHCDRVNAPAALLHIKSDFVEEQIARHAGAAEKSTRSLYPYFFPLPEAEQISRRMLEMCCLRPQTLANRAALSRKERSFRQRQ
jgi:hypothetical protein